ncbi:MAG: thiamine phosphate synthase [Verrucomicrobiae bacterium]|jgi:thiamine-phosphate pyrophosphorylase|nr:thiamine phosphate synthase [Verrucomicrobiae bacterium]
MSSLLKARFYGILDTQYVMPSKMGVIAEQLLRGGIDILQLRAKESSEEEIIMMAKQILPLTQAAKVPFIINDYPHIVSIVGAQGVHLGQEDLDIREARAMLGKEGLIGLSTHSLEQVEKSLELQPDYIGFGPLFSTPTKPLYSPIGLQLITQVQERVSFPVFCIGGITLVTLPQVLQAGAKRIVMVSALLKDEDRVELISHIKQTFLTDL